MSSKHRLEPGENCGEQQETEIMVWELFIADVAAAEVLDPDEEVFHGMTLAVEAPAEPAGPTATGSWRDARAYALIDQRPAEVIRVEPAIGERPTVAEAR